MIMLTKKRNENGIVPYKVNWNKDVNDTAYVEKDYTPRKTDQAQ